MLSFSPFGGLKLNLLSFHITFIIDAKTLSYERLLANFDSLCKMFVVIFGYLLWYILCRKDSLLFVIYIILIKIILMRTCIRCLLILFYIYVQY